MLPLRYADIPSYILSASLFCTNADFELELMYCKVKDVSSYPPQTYTQHTTLTLHTPLSLICISSPLISYHINLTLYMGQCFARNIYSRHMTLTIFLWRLLFLLINFLLIFDSLSFLDCFFADLGKTPAQTSAKLLQLTPSQGALRPLRLCNFDHWVIVADE